MAVPPSLGRQVTWRQFSLLELVSREWGSSYRAPDHGIYSFANGARKFDSTDMGTTGFYQRGILSLQSESGADFNAEAAPDDSGDPLLIG